MDKILAAQGLRVRCLDRGSDVLAQDQTRCIEALCHCNPGRALAPWRGRFDLTTQDFVVLISGSGDDRLLGMLTATERHTGYESFLLLEAAYIAPAGRGLNLLQRMTAVALLNALRLDPVPPAIVACTQDEAMGRDLRALSRRIGHTASFPQPQSNVVDIRMAGLGQRIARVVRPGAPYATATASFTDQPADYRLVLLTLDATQETDIAADARRLFVRRPPRRAVAEEFVQGQCLPAVLPVRPPRDGAMR